jgi:hypothetical protein
MLLRLLLSKLVLPMKRERLPREPLLVSQKMMALRRRQSMRLLLKNLKLKLRDKDSLRPT